MMTKSVAIIVYAILCRQGEEEVHERVYCSSCCLFSYGGVQDGNISKIGSTSGQYTCTRESSAGRTYADLCRNACAHSLAYLDYRMRLILYFIGFPSYSRIDAAQYWSYDGETSFVTFMIT